MHRVFCTAIPPVGETAPLEPGEREHLFKVLRASVGMAVELLDGNGTVAAGTVVEGRAVRVDSVRRVPEPELKLHLACALPRRQKLDQMLKQAAELGVWSIRPLKCIRSVADGDPRQRWEAQLREACKQSGNPFLPRLLPEEKLLPALERLKEEGVELYYGSVVPGETPAGTPKNDRALLIGPEGGFAPEELETLTACGAKPFNFAPYILRLETAAVCGLAVLRRLGVAVMLAAALAFAAGCGRAPTTKHPLLIRGAKLKESGDYVSARRFFRRAIAARPDEPDAYLALAQLCDEYLDDPLEALFCYRNYLQLTRPGTPEHEAAKNIAAYLEKKATKRFGGEHASENAALRRENDELRQRLAALTERAKKVEKMMIRQQAHLIRLNEELAVEKQKNMGEKQ